MTKILSDRKRFFLHEELKAKRGEAERSVKSHTIYGTNADILKCALTLFYRQLPMVGHVVLTVHDEIVLECPVPISSWHIRMRWAIL